MLIEHGCLYLQVPEDILVERVIGRRLDPVSGKIYHLKYSPPETEEIAARLTQRFDDTEEKVCSCSKPFYLGLILSISKKFWVLQWGCMFLLLLLLSGCNLVSHCLSFFLFLF